MTTFEKRIERIETSLGPPPQKMTFIYADGRQVEVTGLLEAFRQDTKGEGLVDVLGASEGLKNFLLAAQCDINTLWEDESEEGGGCVGGFDEQGMGVCPGAPAASPAKLAGSQDHHPLRAAGRGAVCRPKHGGKHHRRPGR